MNQNPIFIFGPHKSGSSLLRSLLDSHPQLFVIPVESHVFARMGFGIVYDKKKQDALISDRSEIAKRFAMRIKESNETTDLKGGSYAFNKFDMDIFKKNITKINEESNLQFIIETYFSAIYASLTGKKLSEDIRIVEKSVEHAEFAQLIKILYPSSKMIHIIRNPYSNIVSWRKYSSTDKKYPQLAPIIKSLILNYKYLINNKRTIDDYYVIKYEELVTSPESEMGKLSDFLQIEYQSSLISPTVGGKPWAGNSTENVYFQGISSNRLNSWQDEITSLEVYYINKFFEKYLDEFGYTIYEKNQSFMKPILNETLKSFVHNRMLKYFI